jgi:tetratricopeptide (TPR) repeat protein
MKYNLALELWERVHGQTEAVHDWIFSAVNLANAQAYEGDDNDAEALLRLTMLGLEEKGFDTQHPATLGLRTLLVRVLDNQGKHTEAQGIYERCFTQSKKAYGPDDEATIQTARMLGDNLGRQGKHAEAVAILQDTLERAKRVCGPEDMETLGCYQSLATELGNQDREDEALVVYQKRVLGPDHPSVLLAAMNHALTAARSGQLVEAEAMYAENLVKQTRVGS